MKRVRHEQINISVHHYLKRRQFLVSYSINQNLLLNLKKNTKKVAFHQRSEKHIINAENHKTFHEHNNSPRHIKVTFFFQDHESSQKKESRWAQTISDMAVNNASNGEITVDNLLTYSSISGDATSCDEQFSR